MTLPCAPDAKRQLNSFLRANGISTSRRSFQEYAKLFYHIPVHIDKRLLAAANIRYEQYIISDFVLCVLGTIGMLNGTIKPYITRDSHPRPITVDKVNWHTNRSDLYNHLLSLVKENNLKIIKNNP